MGNLDSPRYSEEFAAHDRGRDLVCRLEVSGYRVGVKIFDAEGCDFEGGDRRWESRNLGGYLHVEDSAVDSFDSLFLEQRRKIGVNGSAASIMTHAFRAAVELFSSSGWVSFLAHMAEVEFAAVLNSVPRSSTAFFDVRDFLAAYPVCAESGVFRMVDVDGFHLLIRDLGQRGGIGCLEHRDHRTGSPVGFGFSGFPVDCAVHGDFVLENVWGSADDSDRVRIREVLEAIWGKAVVDAGLFRAMVSL